jgi:hypothetical protein
MTRCTTHFFFAKLNIDVIYFQMSLAEVPHSVIVRPNPNPDSTSLSLGYGHLRVVEPKGHNVKREEAATSRRLILQRQEPGDIPTFVAFEPHRDLDLVAFFREGEKTTQYAARNGVYIELGAKNNNGQVAARFDLETGERMFASTDIEAFPFFESPMSVDFEDINLVGGVCEQMKMNKRTPSPLDLSKLQAMIGSIIRTSRPQEPSFQPPLPL